MEIVSVIAITTSLLLSVAGVAIWRLARERDRLTALMEAGPRGYWGCEPKSGADVVLCPACAFNKGDVRQPIYGNAILWEWGNDATCFNCKRLLPGSIPMREK